MTLVAPLVVFKFHCKPVNLAEITGALLPTWYSLFLSILPVFDIILETKAEPGQGRGPAVAAQIEITSMNTAM